VADALADFPGLELSTVYGVQVPGSRGPRRHGRARAASGRGLRPAGLLGAGRARLPSYAAPLFLRLSATADMTSTYKLRKVDLQREGFNAAVVKEPLYVRDALSQNYVPLTAGEHGPRIGGLKWVEPE
jgi:fatty-acyl-CoA synthase